MVTTDGTTEEAAAPVEEVASTESTESGPESTGGNPAWGPLRDKLDPISFRSIEGDLKNWDNEAQKRITSLNEQLKPWKPFLDAGHTPEKVAQWQLLAEKIDAEPEAIYEALGKFLESQGRLPSKKELEEAVEDAEGGEELSDDPRIAKLAEQNEKMLQFMQQQEQQRIMDEAEKALTAEISKFEQDHPDYTPSEIKEVIRRAAFISQQSRQTVSLEKANEDYVAFRTELLGKPRPGDSAPNLLPLSGGAPPSSGEQRKISELSSKEMQDMTAAFFSKNRQ